MGLFVEFFRRGEHLRQLSDPPSRPLRRPINPVGRPHSIPAGKSPRRLPCGHGDPDRKRLHHWTRYVVDSTGVCRSICLTNLTTFAPFGWRLDFFAGLGICGVGRLSLRSLAATASFTGTSIATRFLVAPIRSWAHWTDFLRKDSLPLSSPLASTMVMGGLTLATMTRSVAKSTPEDSAKSMGAAVSGVLFAFGLAVSGMAKNSKVHDFLCFSNMMKGDFDPTLMVVMASGVLASWASYQLVREHASTRVTKRRSFVSPAGLPDGCSFNVPKNRVIDARLMTGTVLFGMGWYVLSADDARDLPESATHLTNFGLIA